MLCAKCISMFQNFNKTREGDHHATVDDLTKASQSSCRICIFENLTREQYGTKEDHTRDIPSNTGNDASLKVAEDWLRDYKENHKSCENVYGKPSSGWYPKRLVAIGKDDGKIRLVVANEEHITGGYATLSHCWGRNSSFLTRISDNYEQFRNNISVTVLPKSFRDGIYACRRLNIKNIWIDSLCIIQSGEGSGNDWLHHATEMEMIYSNCVLNLAIVHASSPHDGAFVERNTDFLQDCYLWAPLSSPHPDDKCPRKEFLNDDLPNDDLPNDNSPNEKLRMCVIFASSKDSRGLCNRTVGARTIGR